MLRQDCAQRGQRRIVLNARFAISGFAIRSQIVYDADHINLFLLVYGTEM